MFVAKTTGRFTSVRAARGSDVVVASLVGARAPLVGAALLLPIALILITNGCGPPI